MSVSLWDRLRAAFAGHELYAARIDALNEAIERYPTDAANYILRGELLLELGDAEAAARDFQRAESLALAQLTQDDWGVVAQTMRDRALAGLQTAQRLTKDKNTQDDDHAVK